MAVQVWIGEKPEHPNERRAIVALANGLERLDGLYLILANFSVGGRTVDLVIIKQDAIFIIELKHVDGKVFGDVNGPWFVESANGVRKRLNPGRKNPYNQVISYYYSLINFLNERRSEFLSTNKSSSVDFRTCKRVIVIAPTIQEGSNIDIDWKVEYKGLDELPAYLVTERSSEIDLSDEEMLAIPKMLHCTRWGEVNALIAGVLPAWEETPSEPKQAPPPPPPEPQPAPEPVATPVAASPPTLWSRARRSLATWPGRAAAGFAALALALALILVLRPAPTPPPIDQSATTLLTNRPLAAGVELDRVGNFPAAQSCIWSGFQPVGRKRGAEAGVWENVGVLGAAPSLRPDVVVTLDEVSFCDDRITLTWSVQNNMSDETATLPLTGENIAIRDDNGNQYTITDDQSKPEEIEVQPQDRARGTVVIDRPISINTSTLIVTLNKQPFGEAVWLVSINGD